MDHCGGREHAVSSSSAALASTYEQFSEPFAPPSLTRDRLVPIPFAVWQALALGLENTTEVHPSLVIRWKLMPTTTGFLAGEAWNLLNLGFAALGRGNTPRGCYRMTAYRGKDVTAFDQRIDLENAIRRLGCPVAGIPHAEDETFRK